jgi:uncharacterized protein YidB (DUF937 family)
MALVDELFGKLTGLFGSSDPLNKNIVSRVMDLVNSPQVGGLAGIVGAFESSGLSKLVQSWVSTGKNLSATGQQIEQGLGVEKIKAMAQSLGVTPEVVKAKLAEILPQVIDKLTPDGVVPKK